MAANSGKSSKKLNDEDLDRIVDGKYSGEPARTTVRKKKKKSSKAALSVLIVILSFILVFALFFFGTYVVLTSFSTDGQTNEVPEVQETLEDKDNEADDEKTHFDGNDSDIIDYDSLGTGEEDKDTATLKRPGTQSSSKETNQNINFYDDEEDDDKNYKNSSIKNTSDSDREASNKGTASSNKNTQSTDKNTSATGGNSSASHKDTSDSGSGGGDNEAAFVFD